MIKSKIITDYKFPYVVLVPKMIVYFGVELDGDTEIVKLHNEVTTATLHKIGLKKINDDYWVSQAEDQEGGMPSSTVAANGGNEGIGTSVATVGEGMTLIPYAFKLTKVNHYPDLSKCC